MIETKNLFKTYGQNTALKDVSIKIKQGEITALLGQNGAGKSSLIRCLTRMTTADSGEIFLKNKKLTDKDVVKFGYLPEERGLYQDLKVAEQLTYFARLRGVPKAKAKENVHNWLKALNFEVYANKRTEWLSKGMQQKIQFISAVIHDPEIIILDEPFSGLDPINADEIKNIIKDLHSEGKTIIFSSHNMNTIEALCNNVILIDKGEVIANDSIQNLKKEHSERNFLIKTSDEITQNNLFEIINKEEDFYTINPKSIVSKKEMLEFIVKNYDIQEFREKDISMNDIFIKLVKGRR